MFSGSSIRRAALLATLPALFAFSTPGQAIEATNEGDCTYQEVGKVVRVYCRSTAEVQAVAGAGPDAPAAPRVRGFGQSTTLSISGAIGIPGEPEFTVNTDTSVNNSFSLPDSELDGASASHAGAYGSGSGSTGGAAAASGNGTGFGDGNNPPASSSSASSSATGGPDTGGGLGTGFGTGAAANP